MPVPAKVKLPSSIPCEIMTSEIPQGTWFMGSLKHNSQFTNKLFVKTYNQVVCVEDQVSSWDTNIPIINYRPVAVTISVAGLP